MNLQLIIAVRHGEHDLGTKSLNEKGEKQSRDLAEAIKKLIGPQLIGQSDKIVLLASPTKRAQETGKILSEILFVPHNICSALECDEYCDWTYVMRELVKIIKEEVLIAITHNQMPSGIINGFLSRHLQKSFDSKKINNGEGITLSVKKGDISLIP